MSTAKARRRSRANGGTKIAEKAAATVAAPSDAPPPAPADCECPHVDTPAGVKRVSLALQGGGAHGAFTWGVLDRFLEEPRLDFEGLTATSAGAVNAVAFAHGLRVGGRDGAKAALAELWERIALCAAVTPFVPSSIERLLPASWRGLGPTRLLTDFYQRLFSPYQLNPFNYNPVRDVLAQMIDFEGLRSYCPIRLFLSATNVRSGKVRVFTSSEIGIEHVMASGALPQLFQAVEVDGEFYWDGGYMGNPAIYPLIYHCRSADVIVVHINPIERPTVPKTASEIHNRINEITFNSSMMREMRAIDFVTRLIDEQRVGGDGLKRMFIHSVENDAFMQTLSVETKLDPDWPFLKKLHDVGYETADGWLDANFDGIGERSTTDIRARFL
ncbi:MAG: patatin-like phospholipase family protein [Alphaproteobacteria bacterium]|nr:patatin-like phospholipase family protein [Alphaproteobacteria bacterium]